jgi:hypothetical protein
MKKSFGLLALILAIAAGCIVYVPRDEGMGPSPDSYGVSSQTSYGDRDSSYIYDALTPYGTWVSMNAYGYVWVPRHMGYRWRPYMYGRWIWSDYGWTWISDEEWGWIPFHYGRWGWDDDMGWYWVPGSVWGPAWVFWRTNDLYFGWAPLPPGSDFDLRFGFHSRRYNIPDRYWIFVEGPDFFERDLSRRVIPFERNGTIVRDTVFNDRIVIRDSHVVNEGIDPSAVRRLTGQPVERHVLRDAGQAGREQVSGTEVRIFRPAVRLNKAARPKEFLDSSAARANLDEAKIYEPAPRAADADPAEMVRKRHVEEVQILERSQGEEIRNLDKRFAARETNARAAAEREKIRREHETAASTLKARHGQEKQALSERQKKDRETVTKRTVRRD